MLYVAIDVHRRVFRAAVLDVESGETVERRFGATRKELDDWAMPLRGGLAAVAIEASNGWRWVWQGAERARVRCAPGRSGAGEGAARTDRAREDRPTRRALAVCVVGEGGCCPSRGCRRRRCKRCATRAGCAKQSRRTGPAGGATTACAVDARGVAVSAGAAVDGRGTSLGRVVVAVCGGACARRSSVASDRGGRG